MIELLGWAALVWIICGCTAWVIDLTRHRLEDTPPREYFAGPFKLREVLRG